MMNFYYDPILGLQYFYLGYNIVFDILALPEEFSLGEFLKEYKEIADYYDEIGIEIYPFVDRVIKITNYIL